MAIKAPLDHGRMTEPRIDIIKFNALSQEERVRQLLAHFGWEITDVFRDRYLNDPWVYHLINAALRLQEENDQLRRRLPTVED